MKLDGPHSSLVFFFLPSKEAYEAYVSPYSTIQCRYHCLEYFKSDRHELEQKAVRCERGSQEILLANFLSVDC
jgi:hypothetical protein